MDNLSKAMCVAKPRVIRNRECTARTITDIGAEIEMVPPRFHMSFAGTFIEITVSDNLGTVIFGCHFHPGSLSNSAVHKSVC
jgi:hypothetical protein